MIEVEESAVDDAWEVSLRPDDPDGSPTTSRLSDRVEAALEREPPTLLCDLTDLDRVCADVSATVRAVDAHQRRWPGTAVGIACPEWADALLAPEPLADRIVFGTSVPGVRRALARLPVPEHATTVLASGLRSPRDAREFVARTCVGWRLHAVTGHACLVTSELVTDVVLQARGPVRLAVSHCPGHLRLTAVEDPLLDAPAGPRPALGGPFGRSGRARLLVSSVCRAWGGYDDEHRRGAWAVLDVPAQPQRR